ncbi:MAG TPA: CHAT domain-containing protein [Leptolyngbyaceae cyanobacterium]
MSAPISVVIINYNRQQYLGFAIKSVLQQTNGDFELLIWDDGSTDNSVEIAREYANRDRRIEVVAATHQGYTRSLKSAIAKTTGTYIGWVDSDDLLAPMALAETVKILEKEPQIGLVYTDYIDIDEHNNFIGYGQRCRIPYSPERLLIDFITFHFRLIRRSVFEQVGGIDETFECAQDYDLCLRLSEATEVRQINEPLYYYRHHSGSISQQKRLPQILNAYNAMVKALQRRKLDREWEIYLQIYRENQQIQGRFSLQKKRNSKVANLQKACLWLAAIPIVGSIGITPSFAQSITPAPDGTNTIVNPQGNQYNITGGQTSGDRANLFHSFTQFNLNYGEIANFQSAIEIQNILARVIGGDASRINGLIQVTGSNANLFLMNPAGIVFGANASLNVPGSFLATTANGIGFNNNWFNAAGTNNYSSLVGTPNSFAFTMQQPGSVVNSGNLIVGTGESLTLLGGNVVNTGNLKAPGGQITLASVPGEKLVRLSQEGFVLSLDIQIPTKNENLPNNWDLPVLSLPQLLTGGSGVNATGVSVSEAGQIVLTGSGIRISENGSTAIASGNINVSGEKGGQVNVLGNKVGVVSSNIDASGINGGGNVRIGGDYRGLGKVPNSEIAFISKDSTISADSWQNGDGGRVIVWANKTTYFDGKISAAGGKNAGDGGFIEVSGKENLVFQGTANAAAPNGKTGTLLLDPAILTITDKAAGTGTQDTNLIDGSNILASDADSGENTVSWGQIAALGENANVVLEATGQITIGDVTGATPGVTEFNLVKLGLTSGSLKITSTSGSIAFADVNDLIRTEGGAITFQALGGTLTAGRFNTTGAGGDKFGSVNLEATNDLEVGSIVTNGGEIKLISTSGKITTDNLDSSSDNQGGAISVKANNDITINGFTVDSRGGLTGGNVNLTSTNGKVGFGYGGINTSSSAGTAGDILVKAATNIELDFINAKGATAGGNIQMTGDEINFSGPIAGDTIILEPSTTGRAIAIGDSLEGAGALNITTAEIADLVDGFTSITIGRTDGTGAVTINNKVFFQDDVKIQGGAITANGNIISPGNDLDIISNVGNIDTTNGELNTSSLSVGDGGDITVTAKNGNITIGNINSSSGFSNAGKATFSAANGTINVNGNINSSGGTQGSDITFETPVTLTKDATFTTGKVTGDINFNSTVDGTKQLTLTAGTSGTIRFQAVAGKNAPLGKLDITAAQNIEVTGGIFTANSDITLNSPVILKGDSEFNAGTGKITFGTTLTGDIYNLTFTTDNLNLQNTVTGTGNLIIQPFTPSLNIRLGATVVPDPSILDVGSSLAKLQDGFSLITLGRSDGSGKIAIESPITFKDPVTIQSPVGTGTIIFNGSTLTGVGNASINLIANQNITTASIIAPAGITITSNNGNIDSSIAALDASNSTGKGGDITINTPGDFLHGGILAKGNGGDGGKITVTAGGDIIGRGDEDISSQSVGASGGEITLEAGGDIITDDILSPGTINGGKITAISGGTIDLTKTGNITAGAISCSGDVNCNGGSGKGGDIFFQAVNDIIVSGWNASGVLGGGKIEVTSSSGAVSASMSSAATNGDAGDITVKAFNNITASGINSSAGGSGKGGAITATSTAGTIDTSSGTVKSSSASGIAGAIAFESPINIIVNAIDSTGIIDTGNITLTSNQINFTGAANSVKGKGIIQLQPFTASQNLNIAAADFTTLADGFSAIVFGRKDGSGIITLANPISFQDSVTIQSPSGTILVDGAITGTDDASITINGATNLNANLTTADRNITITGNTAIGKNVTISTGATSGGDIQFNGKIDGNNDITLETGIGNLTVSDDIGSATRLGNIIINSGNNITAKSITATSITQKSGTGTTSLGALNTNSPQGINLTGNIFNLNGIVITTNSGNFIINNSSPLTLVATTNFFLDGAFKQTGVGAVSTAADITTNNNDISFASPVTLIGNVVLNSDIGGGDIQFGNIVDGNFDLTLKAGTGNILFNAPVGEVTRIGNLIIDNANDIKATSITAASINQKSGAGTSNLGNLDTNTAAGINLKGNSFILNGNVTTTNAGGFIIDNASPLTLAASNKINLDGVFAQIGEGTVSTAANITTNNNDISFVSPVTLTGNVTLNTGAGAGDIAFGDIVDGNFDLILSPGAGSITFAGAVGSEIRIGNLIIENANDITSGGIIAASITQNAGTGTSTFGNLDTNTATGINLIGNIFNLNGNVTTTNGGGFTINNNSPLNLAATTNFNLDGAFKQIGAGVVSTAANITTNNNDISFASPVTLTGNITLNTGGSGDIEFNDIVDGNRDFTLNSGTGNITFGGAIGSQTRLGNLVIENANDILANGSITAASITQQSGTGTTILGSLDTNTPAGINLTGNKFSFNSAITATNNGGVTLNNSGQVNIADTADMNLTGKFNQIGQGSIFTSGDITTNNNDIRFAAPVILTGNVTFNPGTAAIVFASTLSANNNPLTLTAGQIDFGDIVSGTNTLTLQPATQDANVAIGTPILGAFNITTSEIAFLQDGFSNIIIGRDDSTGNTTINNVTFYNPVTIRGGTGAMQVNGLITGIGNASITLDSATTTLNANITTAGESIAIGRRIILGNDVTLSTGKADIVFNGIVDGNRQLTLNAGSGNVRFNGAVGAVNPLANLDINGQRIFVAGGINTTNGLSFNIPITLTDDATFSGGAGNDIAFNIIDNQGDRANNLFLNPGNGNVTFNAPVKGIGDIVISSANNLTVASTIEAASLQHSNGTGEINLQGNVITTGVGVDLRTDGSIRTADIISNNGNITAVSNNSNVEVGNLDASSAKGAGGAIALYSEKGAVIGKNLRSTGETAGGSVTVVSGDRISLGNIDVSATVGKGGVVFIDPPNDVEVGTLKAQGGNDGAGGSVDITTARFFRSNGSFIDRNGIDSSISTAGSTSPGSIIIRHGGGDLNTPFIVGSSAANGSSAALTTGVDTIVPTQSFPGPFTIGNIQLITSAPPPPPPPPPETDIPSEISQTLNREQNTGEQTIIESVPRTPIDSELGLLEEVFTRQYEAYIAQNTPVIPVTIKTLSEIQASLRQADKQTGVKTALLYIVFGRNRQGLDGLVACPRQQLQQVGSGSTSSALPVQDSSIDGIDSSNLSIQRGSCQSQASDEVEIVLVTAEGLPKRQRLPNLTRSQIMAVAKQFQSEVTDKTKLDTTSYLQPAQQLYQWLIPPIEPILKAQGIENLVFIPDAGLRSLPVAALNDGKQFLVERYSVSLMPSFSLTNPRYFSLKNSSVLAMGADKFTDLSPLPAVPVELSTIANQLWSGEVAINEDFTVNNLKSLRTAKPFGIVHLATHAQFLPGPPRNSFIQFWDTKLGIDQMRDFSWNDPPVHLLVLSACRTAIGDLDVELGFGGLAIQAGVKTTLASLWYVSDEGTLGLMTEFYEQLQTAPIRAEALRKAQVALLTGEVRLENGQLLGVGNRNSIPLPVELSQLGNVSFTHPYYWASFTMIGNPW